MCEWRSSDDPAYRCGVKAEPGSRLCILHEKKDKSVEQFAEAFRVQIEAADAAASRNRRCDFRGYVFPVGVASSHYKGLPGAAVVLPSEVDDLVFDEATIMGDVLLPNTEINGCLSLAHAEIAGNVLLTRTRVNDSVKLRSTRVEGDVSLECAIVGGDLDLEDVAIHGDLCLHNARVRGCASCMFAYVGERTTLDNSRFGGDVDFRNSVFEATASFLDCKVRGNLGLSGCDIRGEASLERITVEGEAVLSATAFGRGLSANGSRFHGKVAFDTVRVRGDADLRFGLLGSDASFAGTGIDGVVSFADVVFPGEVDFRHCTARGLDLGEDRPRISGFRESSRCGVVIRDWQRGWIFWRLARVTLEKEGSRAGYDAARYFERLWMWRALRSQRRSADSRRSIHRGILRAIYTALWVADVVFLRWTTAYGGSILRLFLTWFLVIGGFASAYAAIPALLGREIQSVWSVENWLIVFHYSATTFATLGLGDLQPATLTAKALTSIEALLGGLLMALAVLVIGRKFMR
jgi:hypothetical protein